MGRNTAGRGRWRISGATVDLLTVFPELGRLREELRPDVRSFKLRRFPHIVFYRFDGTGVTLLRLLHAALDELLALPRAITMWEKMREDRAGAGMG
jgi:plasmid stabilization system protein ParE